jgi:L-fuconolactonase
MPHDIIDSHFHLWNLAREDYWWFREMPALNRDFMQDDYEPLRLAAGIEKAIIVQALESVTETDFMLDLSAKHNWIAGVIGWTDFEAENSSRAIVRLARHERFLGFRNWAVGRPDDDWLNSGKLDRSFSTLVDMDLTYDALVGPKNLSSLITRLQKHPKLKLCVNHFAYPLPEWQVDGHEETLWKMHLKKLSDLGAVIKFSGFGHKTNGIWETAPYDRFVEFALKCFGPSKVIWASNWPTVVKECSFDVWLEACQKWTSHLSAEDRASIFGGTAQSFYRI